jgi:hypothetical protein
LFCCSKGKVCKFENFWLNMQMISSKCMVSQFHSLIFMQVNVQTQCSSSTKSIAYTILSSANLMYVKILFPKIWKEVKVFHNLVSGSHQNVFALTTYWSRTIVNPCTSSCPTFFKLTKCCLDVTKWTLNLFLGCSCNQCHYYTTPNAFIKSWVGNWPWNFIINWMAFFTLTFQIHNHLLIYVLCKKRKCPHSIEKCGWVHSQINEPQEV